MGFQSAALNFSVTRLAMHFYWLLLSNDLNQSWGSVMITKRKHDDCIEKQCYGYFCKSIDSFELPFLPKIKNVLSG
jgi:hypothetical protein